MKHNLADGPPGHNIHAAAVQVERTLEHRRGVNIRDAVDAYAKEAFAGEARPRRG